MKDNKKLLKKISNYLFMLLFVLVLGCLLTIALVLVDFYTKPIIKLNHELKVKSSVLLALSIPYKENLEEVYKNKINEKTIKNKAFYISDKGEYAIPFTGPGLWGPISGILALEPDFLSIKGITIIKQEETPGLGSRITEKKYVSGLINKRFSPELVLLPSGKTASFDYEIDSITGATMTCTAFTKIINNTYKEYINILKGGDN